MSSYSYLNHSAVREGDVLVHVKEIVELFKFRINDSPIFLKIVTFIVKIIYHKLLKPCGCAFFTRENSSERDLQYWLFIDEKILERFLSCFLQVEGSCEGTRELRNLNLQVKHEKPFFYL